MDFTDYIQESKETMWENQSKNVQGLKLPKNGYTTWVFQKN